MSRAARGTGSMACRGVIGAALLLLAPAAAALGQVDALPTDLDTEPGLFAIVGESLFGDVYDESRWRPLTLGSFFTDGWLEPWAAAPAGREGLTPRHGWLGAFNGVFYRLWSADFTYTNSLNAPYHGNSYSLDVSLFLPFSKRFELLIDDTPLAANGTTNPRRGYISQTGDLSVVPRFLLAEDEATSHVVALGIETPTGAKATGGGLLALSPRYEFWTNPVGAWVARGSCELNIPLGRAGSPTDFVGGLAIGRYFTPHDVPFGDLVFYAASDFSVPLDHTSSTATAVTLGPGTRFHLGRDFYFLNEWSFPVTGPHPSAYSVQFAVVKVF